MQNDDIIGLNISIQPILYILSRYTIHYYLKKYFSCIFLPPIYVSFGLYDFYLQS